MVIKDLLDHHYLSYYIAYDHKFISYKVPLNVNPTVPDLYSITQLQRIGIRIVTKDRDGDSAWQLCKPPEIYTGILHLQTINTPVERWHTKLTVKMFDSK